MADLKRLASLCALPDRVVRLAFLNGLPTRVGAQLKTAPTIKEMTLDMVVDLARRLMAASDPLELGIFPAAARTKQVEVAATADWRKLKCFNCS